MNVVVVKAGGIGQRVGDEYGVPKQFIEVDGKPIIIYSLEGYEKSNADRIIIACHKNYIDLLWDYVKKYKITKVYDIIQGGENARDSFIAGVDRAREFMTDEDILLMQDAAAPFVTPEMVNKVIEETEKYGAARMGIRAEHTSIQELDTEKHIYDYVGIYDIYWTYSPQGIKLGKLDEYEKKVKEIGKYDKYTCVSSLCALIQAPCKMVLGSSFNNKITFPYHIDYFRAIIEGDVDYSKVALKENQ